eukprot:TRINITY_DN105414_c0_g1_i1.p1 TRINITY_DN105414_c0_g1~~TRINITY_DN105414_c0_g1_i1.p1  ORF type:complete len:488 (-),score=100.41 TRINITY_DN105414_c0_g1_i1:7-1470(-)
MRHGRVDLSALEPIGTDGGCNALALSSHRERLASPLEQESMKSVQSTPSVGSRAWESSTVHFNFQREIELTESRLLNQVAKAREGLTNSMEIARRLHEAAVHRLDQKIAEHEASQTRIERRLAEVSGGHRSLEEQAQAHSRRADDMDGKFWELRRQLEDMLKQRTEDIQRQLEEGISKCGVLLGTGEGFEKRVGQRMQQMDASIATMQERMVRVTGRVISGFQERLMALEQSVVEQQVQDVQAKLAAAFEDTTKTGEARGTEGMQTGQDATRLWKLEMQLADCSAKLDNLSCQAYGDSGWEFRLTQHDVGMSAFRSKLDSLSRVVNTLCAGGAQEASPRQPEHVQARLPKPHYLTLSSDQGQQDHHKHLVAVPSSGDAWHWPPVSRSSSPNARTRLTRSLAESPRITSINSTPLDSSRVSLSSHRHVKDQATAAYSSTPQTVREVVDDCDSILQQQIEGRMCEMDKLLDTLSLRSSEASPKARSELG